MIKYTYLLIDLLSILVPRIFSFHAKIRLYKHWDAVLPAIFISAAFYILWDSWFAHLGVWGFNPTYITGIYIGNLPLEEIQFFICIPYACVFTFECISGIIPASFLQNKIKPINYSVATILLILSVIFRSRPYTATAFVLPSLMIFVAILKGVAWLPKFYLIYGVLLVPFLVVNGLLTGTGLSRPIVWYNPDGIIGLRLLTIPIEDIFYGMGLILCNIWIYTWLRSREWQLSRLFN
ncbi:MAG: lycopene cyclase domain-containing protein [Mucilaginibacter sp.]